MPNPISDGMSPVARVVVDFHAMLYRWRHRLVLKALGIGPSPLPNTQ